MFNLESAPLLLIMARAVTMLFWDGYFEILGFCSESIGTFCLGLFDGVAAAITFAPFKSLELITWIWLW